MIRSALALLLLGAAPALACSPSELVVDGRWSIAESCQRSRALNTVNAVALGRISDLGNGLVSQDLIEGNACYFDAYKLVQDCATGQGLLIGPEKVALMEGPKRSALATMEQRLLARPEAPTLTGVAALATTRVLRLEPGRALRFDGVTMPLDCACKTAYPALKPRG